MSTTRKAEKKPLSFSTTMRNPERIASFLKCVFPYEGKILTHKIIMQIMKSAIRTKIYKPLYISRNPLLNAISLDENSTFSDSQIEEIIANSPQNHKEAGFEAGWDSRFDTYFKLPKEYGFLFYQMNAPISISTSGRMIVEALNETPVNNEKITNVFLNSMAKYQSNNPFRKNANSNIPLLLLLRVLNKLNQDKTEKQRGIYKQELSLFICWSDNDADSLYKKIKEIRTNVGFRYSDEYMWEICLNLLDANESQQNRFKSSQICGELVDEYIRKMRTTGLLSLRGNGRFLDFNHFEDAKIKYILDNYGQVKDFANQEEYYRYVGEIDPKILEFSPPKEAESSALRQATLRKFADEYSNEKVTAELCLLAEKKNSADPVLKYINQPVRLEFLIAVFLLQRFQSLRVSPNYTIDDEGLPVGTAPGLKADIECYDADSDSIIETTLMFGRSDQINNEMIPITRHLKLYKANSLKTYIFAIFIAPLVHEDVRQYVAWEKFRDDLDILAYSIKEFIEAASQTVEISDLLQVTNNV